MHMASSQNGIVAQRPLKCTRAPPVLGVKVYHNLSWVLLKVTGQKQSGISQAQYLRVTSTHFGNVRPLHSLSPLDDPDKMLVGSQQTKAQLALLAINTTRTLNPSTHPNTP